MPCASRRSSLDWSYQCGPFHGYRDCSKTFGGDFNFWFLFCFWILPCNSHAPGPVDDETGPVLLG